MPIPICYDAAYSEETGLSHIILENLANTHTILPPGPPSKQHCEKAIDSLAELHAFWWNHHKLEDLSRNSFVLWTLKEDSFNENDIFDWFKNQNSLFMRYSEQFFEDRISDKRQELFKKVFLIYPQVVYKRLKKKNITVIHGDAHFWNFLYPKDINNENLKASLTDWATWGLGPGCQDLAFMIGIFLTPDNRRYLEKNLIKRYYNSLLKFGVENYSWDECWYDYKLLALLNPYRVVEWKFREPLNETVWSLIENVISTIEDLNCMELLE